MKKKRKKNACKLCNKTGHNAATCTNKMKSVFVGGAKPYKLAVPAVKPNAANGLIVNVPMTVTQLMQWYQTRPA